MVSNGGVYVPEIEAAGIRHYAAPLNRRSVGSMLQAQRILRQVIAREKPDIVHAHARIPAFLCGRLQKSMGFAFVTSCHGVYQVSGALRLLSNWGSAPWPCPRTSGTIWSASITFPRSTSP